MKLIDLLNKIANGEDIKAFKYDDYIFKYDIDRENWKNENADILSTYCNVEESLNDEVEIIEEDEKIRKICTFPGLDDDDYAYEAGNKPNNVKINNMMEQLLINKINEIIDYINKGESDD